VSDQGSDTPILDLLAGMTALSLEASTLDAQSLMLTRIAALVASDAPPISYALNLRMAGEMDLDAGQVRSVFAAIAPIVGTARIATAVGNIVKALALQDLAEFDPEQPAA
jgi:4-carboxymuconolactone decarboxylase